MGRLRNRDEFLAAPVVRWWNAMLQIKVQTVPQSKAATDEQPVLPGRSSHTALITDVDSEAELSKRVHRELWA
jgi:hypothetical protein